MKVESNSEGNSASCYCLFQAGRQLCLLNILKSSYLFLFYFRCHVSFGFHLREACFLQIPSIFYIGSWKCQSLNIYSFYPFSYFFCLNIYSSQFVYNLDGSTDPSKEIHTDWNENVTKIIMVRWKKNYKISLNFLLKYNPQLIISH